MCGIGGLAVGQLGRKRGHFGKATNRRLEFVNTTPLFFWAAICRAWSPAYRTGCSSPTARVDPHCPSIPPPTACKSLPLCHCSTTEGYRPCEVGCRGRSCRYRRHGLL